MKVGSRKSARPRAHQRVGKLAPDRQARIAKSQRTVDMWDRGTAALEAKMAKQRKFTHAFEQMGRLPACERCGSGINELLNGKRIHFGES